MDCTTGYPTSTMCCCRFGRKRSIYRLHKSGCSARHGAQQHRCSRFRPVCLPSASAPRNLLAFGTACVADAHSSRLATRPGLPQFLLTLSLRRFRLRISASVVLNRRLERVYPEEGRRAALGTYNFSGDVGKFVLGGAVSLLSIAGAPWQVPVTAFGGLGLGMWPWRSSFLLKEPEVHVHSPSMTSSAGTRGPSGWGISQNCRRGFFALCLIEIIDAATRTGFLTFIAFLMIAKQLPVAGRRCRYR